jgi:hypothetical protein
MAVARAVQDCSNPKIEQSPIQRDWIDAGGRRQGLHWEEIATEVEASLGNTLTKARHKTGQPRAQGVTVIVVHLKGVLRGAYCCDRRWAAMHSRLAI